MVDPADRKAGSIRLLRELGVPILEGLPMIESADETELRAPDEVARRILCLMVVSGVAKGQDLDECRSYLRRNGLYPHLSPAERAFLDGEDDREQTRINMTWRWEAACVLLWTLGKFSSLPLPDQQTDGDVLFPHLPSFDESALPWVESAALIDKERILDQSDLIYRMHWATCQASLDGVPLERLDGDVVEEWHHAINWVTCYEDEEWDAVSTDT